MKVNLKLLLGLVAINVLLSGCFKDGITIPFGEKGESITVGKDGENEISIESKNEEGESFSFEMSSDGKLPDEFPDHIPLMKNYKVISTTTVNSNNEKGIQVIYTVEEFTLDEVWEMYQNFQADNGYEANMSMRSEGYNNLFISNERESIAITMYADKNVDEQDIVTVQIIYNETE